MILNSIIFDTIYYMIFCCWIKKYSIKKHIFKFLIYFFLFKKPLEIWQKKVQNKLKSFQEKIKILSKRYEVYKSFHKNTKIQNII